MSANDLKKMTKEFEETGSFELKCRRGRKSIVLISVDDMTTALQESTGQQTCNTLEIAQSLDIPVRMVYKILCNILHCHAHKTTYIQELFLAVLPINTLLL